jgi:hypothetical protein
MSTFDDGTLHVDFDRRMVHVDAQVRSLDAGRVRRPGCTGATSRSGAHLRTTDPVGGIDPRAWIARGWETG